MWPCPNCNVATEYQKACAFACTATSQYFSRFLADYEFIRAAEGRGSNDPDYYLALPYKDISGKLSDQWAIRARTFRYLERHILAPLATRQNRPLRILDLGAGNGWMSYRLALLGHPPVAVDLLITNRTDLARPPTSDMCNLSFPGSRLNSITFHLPLPPSISSSSTPHFTTRKITEKPWRGNPLYTPRWLCGDRRYAVVPSRAQRPRDGRRKAHELPGTIRLLLQLTRKPGII